MVTNITVADDWSGDRVANMTEDKKKKYHHT